MGDPRRKGTQGSMPPPGGPPDLGYSFAEAPLPASAPAPAAVENLRSLDSRRLGARIIDWLLFLVPTIALQLTIGPLGWAAWVVSLWATVVYFFLCEALTGQTVGKRLLGLRVVRRDGSPAGTSSIAARNVVRIAEEPLIALLVLVGSRRRRQRVGDLIAGTTVGRAAGSRPPARSRFLAGYPALWAVGGAVFLLLIGPPTGPGGSYPPAPSLAGEMTPEWREFAAGVDRACAANFNAGVAQRSAISARADSEGWDRRSETTALLSSYATAQQATYDAIATLGEPPAKSNLFARWHNNVGRRAVLMRRRAAAWADGNSRLHLVMDRRILALKIDADRMGQRFGLTVCTSNGPGREPEALAAENPRRAHRRYLAAVNRVCLDRNAQEDTVSRRRGLTTNDTIDLSFGETLNIAAIAPPPDDYDLRRRILGLKRNLDRESKAMIETVAPSPHPNHTLNHLLPGLTRLSNHVQLDLQRLGLEDCGNWGPAPAPSLLRTGEAKLPMSMR
jgi:uncharacterized RDD family membrane protein YckC